MKIPWLINQVDLWNLKFILFHPFSHDIRGHFWRFLSCCFGWLFSTFVGAFGTLKTHSNNLQAPNIFNSRSFSEFLDKSLRWDFGSSLSCFLGARLMGNMPKSCLYWIPTSTSKSPQSRILWKPYFERKTINFRSAVWSFLWRSFRDKFTISK